MALIAHQLSDRTIGVNCWRAVPRNTLVAACCRNDSGKAAPLSVPSIRFSIPHRCGPGERRVSLLPPSTSSRPSQWLFERDVACSLCWRRLRQSLEADTMTLHRPARDFRNPSLAKSWLMLGQIVCWLQWLAGEAVHLRLRRALIAQCVHIPECNTCWPVLCASNEPVHNRPPLLHPGEQHIVPGITRSKPSLQSSHGA